MPIPSGSGSSSTGGVDQPGSGWAPNVSVSPGLGMCSKWANYSASAQAYATRVAIRVVWAATGRRYGLQQVLVRPSRPVQAPLYRTYPVGFAGYGFWTLFGVNGGAAFQVIGTCGCGPSAITGVSSCGCSGADISIPDDVSGIVAVVIDGVTIDPSTYILSGGYLTRTDGTVWPSIQNFSIPLGQAGTWSITYSQGIPVPDDLNDAAGLYACQIGAAVTGGSCQLPNRVQSITRQGLDIQYIDPGNYLESNRTGYDLVDSIIATYNPDGLRQRSRILSLDMPQFRR